MQYIKAPMNYIGNKYRIMGQIQKWFPREVNLMVDIFCGGCDVTFNTAANEHIANDLNFFVIDIYKEFQRLGVGKAIEKIDKTICDWKLTKENKTAYENFREYYNRTKNPLDLYVLMCFSFNYQFRFNSAHEYNNPFGKSRSSFNDVMRENLTKLQGIIERVRYTSCDFREFDYNLMKSGDFLYADPPYLITCGSYNDGKRGFKGWGEKDERALYDILDMLSERGIKFALSNVSHHKGEKNSILLDWRKTRKYHMHRINFNYDNCNYHTKNGENSTREVLITNY
ncbi:MAG: Dam family site-specific DNA-(adenine-N6)-methyltransferase [Muribaculaceae bacterium]|nr:Dam family site-specific DNA-(adenine-N6)-methyltransferase [Muribaculaceae bacterium]MCM1494059.1 Dam family site-specific DNA-(adenine-N6)-methyltransferase [Muribaculaceae bacterium]